jgi:hypothetical protein
VENWTSGSANIAVQDNDNYINVALPANGWEGQMLSGAGTLTLGGTAPSDTVVNLLSSNPSEVSVPAVVTVPAGRSSVTFDITLINGGTKHAPLSISVSASATGLTGGSANITVHDSNLDHLAFNSITGTKTAGTAFAVTLQAYNQSNEVIAVYNGTLTLSAAGTSGSEPVTATSATFSQGVWTGNVTLTVADPAVTLTSSSGGQSASSNSLAVQGGAVSTFIWGPITSPQIAAVSFPETITGFDAYCNVASSFSGTVNLSGLVVTTSSQTLLGSVTNTGSYTGVITSGWAFTPNATAVVTAVRSFWGTKVSIWTDSGTLLASQAVSGTPGAWTETPLTTPVTLTAGTRYRVAAYTTATSYYRTDTPTFSWATFNGGFSTQGDGFPTSTNVYTYLVDLRANVAASTTVPTSPSTLSFTNGVWNGNITVVQAAAGMHLHLGDSLGHASDSGSFDVIQQVLSLALPSDVRQDDGVDTGWLSVSPAPANDLIVNLVSSDPSRLTVPATITIPAGQTSVRVSLTLIGSTLLLGLEKVTITASAASYPNAQSTVNVHDNQSAGLSVSLATTLSEGNTVVGTISSSAAPATDITINLVSSNPGRASVPTTVVLPAGQRTVNFVLSAIDDHVIDGTGVVSVDATADNWIGGYGSIAIQDVDNYILVSIPASGWEGQTLKNAGTVTLGGTLSSNITINLASSLSTELVVPAAVVIPAGQRSVLFDVNLLDDGLKIGTQNLSVSGSASGLTTGSAAIAAHDSELDHLSIYPIGSPQTAGTIFTVLATAYNIANEVIQVFSGMGTLIASGQGGAEPVTPTTVGFANGTWSGSVTLTVADPTVVLNVAAGGVNVSSNTFAVLPAAVSSFQWSPVSGPQVAGTPFNETIAAYDKYGNIATNFNGSANLSGLVGAFVSNTLFGSVPAPTSNYNFGTFTIGHSFTPSSDIQVTAVRSYSGSKVEIWTNSGTLLLSQPVSGPVGSWTETPLATPLSLSSGVTYRLATYTAGQVYYGRSDMSNTSPLGTINTGYEIPGDAFPTSSSSWKWIFVDFRANVGSFTSAPVSPTGVTFANGMWSGGITVPQAESVMHLHVDDGAGHTGDSGSFSVSPAAPGAPTLTPASDTGLSSSDGITRLNNSSPATALTFQVANTVSGATVTIYANGTAIGSALANGTTTFVTTDGSTALPDGAYVITATQSLPSGKSPPSSGLNIQVDTTTPTPTITPIVPNPVTSPVSSLVITFGQPVYGMTLPGLSLTRNGGANLLTAAQTLTSTDGVTWTLSSLDPITAFGGSYTLSLNAGAAQSIAGNPSAAASQSWQNVSAPADSISGTGGNDTITLAADTDGTEIDWTMGASGGVLPANDPQGLSINGNGGNETIWLDYSHGDPLPAALHLQGNFTINNLQGSNPLAGTTLDIGTSTVYFGYTTSDPLSLIQNYLKAGYNGGGWNGAAAATTGVITSASAKANSNHTTAVAYADFADGQGINTVPNTIELKYTLVGDTDLDGMVNSADLQRLLTFYNSSGAWGQGDINYDGMVNSADLQAILSTFNSSLGDQTAGAAYATASATAQTPPAQQGVPTTKTSLELTKPTAAAQTSPHVQSVRQSKRRVAPWRAVR